MSGFNPALGVSTKAPVARPDYFKRELDKIAIKSTMESLAEVYKLPVMQQLQAMQDLGQDELSGLDELEKLCIAEVKYLLERLKPVTVSSVLTEYRRILDSEGYENHPYQLYFKMPRELAEGIRTEYRGRVMAENQSLVPLSDVDAIIDMGQRLLKARKSYMKIAIGLCCVTGRRPSEILTTASFEPTGEYAAIFSGQLKTKDSDKSRDNYEIPLLAPASEVVEALRVLRGMRDFTGESVPPGKTLAQAINSKTAKNQGAVVRQFFDGLIPNGYLKPYALRAIYATVCIDRLKPESMTDQAYVAEILGHSEDDTATAASYRDFFIKH